MKDGTEIDMYTYRPKTLESQSAPVYFYAHGGGAFAMDANLMHHYLSFLADNL